MKSKLKIVLAIGLVLASNCTFALSFQGLGDLSGGRVESYAYGVSADGSTVVGESYSANGLEAFRWTKASGMVSLGDLSGGTFSSTATAVSADGSVIVGRGNSVNGDEAFRWTQGNGMQGLGDLSNGTFSSAAKAVSYDGSVVVGVGSSANGGEAFRWQNNTMTGLGYLNNLTNDSYSRATGVSADGSVLVGQSSYFDGYGTSARPFLWTQAGGMDDLNNLYGANAYSISADGSTVVGFDFTASGQEAFRWTQANGIVGLGGFDFSGGMGFMSKAYSVSANGNTIVGSAISNSTPTAFLWDAQRGIQSLNVILATSGINLTGWGLESAQAVSADGLTIVGYGYHNDNREAWIANLAVPEPSNFILLLLGLFGLVVKRVSKRDKVR